MKRLLSVFGALLIAVSAMAFDYPPEVIGDGPGVGTQEVRMVPFVIDGPVSIPVDGGLGYVGRVTFGSDDATVFLQCLANESGVCVSDAPAIYRRGVEFSYYPEHGHYRREWIDIYGNISYDIWVLRSGVIEWHSGDWEIGHAGQSYEFGIWHVGYAEDLSAYRPHTTLKGMSNE